MTRFRALLFVLALCLSAKPVGADSNGGITTNIQLESLAVAIRDNESEVIRDLLRAGTDPDGVLSGPPFGATVLMVAAAEGNTDAMRMLMDAGADLDLGIGASGSALHAAAKHGRLEAVRLLLDSGADGDMRDEIYQTTPLSVAVWHGHEPVVALLLQRGVCVECERDLDDGSSNSPMVDAASWGHTGIVELLLAAGADVHRRSGAGSDFYGTPLVHAAGSGKGDVVEILVAAGAELNPSGNTPLHLAAEQGHLEIVRQLVSLGADLNAPDYDGRTALMLARNRGQDAVAAYLEGAEARQ